MENNANMAKLDLVKARVHSVYEEAGVNTKEADAGLSGIVSRIKQTWPKDGFGKVMLDIGYFANVIDVEGVGIAICTDGVGSKSIIAQMMNRYDTIGIDCVAMNVNDLICVGAKPASLVDYIAVEAPDAGVLDQIGIGLADGAKLAKISISGGEITQLKDTVHGFDLVGMAIGRVDLDKILIGQNIAEGDVVIGIRGNGIHCNGLSLAREAFFGRNNFSINHHFVELDCSIGEELLKPTPIYVPEAMELLESVAGVKALINITSDGLLNLTRVSSDVGYIIDSLPDPNPIFPLIQDLADVLDGEMFEVFNMGVGFCVVVGEHAVEQTFATLRRHNREAQIIGYAVADKDKRVKIPKYNLEGKGKTFRKISSENLAN